MPKPRKAWTVVWSEYHQKYLPQASTDIPVLDRMMIYEARQLALQKNLARGENAPRITFLEWIRGGKK